MVNFATMRRIDSLIGRPLTWVAGRFARQPRSLCGDELPTRLPERVICAKFIGIGSVVLCLPLLRRLRESGVRIAFWTFPGPAALLRASGLADEIWVIEASLRGFLPSLWRGWRAARRFRAQAFLDMEPTANFSALLALASGTPVRAGFMSAKPARERLLTHRVALAPEHHMVEHLLRMGSLLGLPRPSVDADVRDALPILADGSAGAGLTDTAGTSPGPSRRRIIINVNASELSWHRLWPDAHWVGLCRALLAEDAATELVFPGTAAEAPRVQAVIDALQLSPQAAARAVNLAGRTSIAQLLEIIAGARLVVTIDSGILHLACLTPTPIVALFGPETPTLFAPRSPRSTVIWAELPCSPCLTVAAEKVTACRDNQCMQRIPPEQVLRACREWLHGERAVRRIS